MPIQKVEASPEENKPPLPKRWIKKKSKGVVKSTTYEEKKAAAESLKTKENFNKKVKFKKSKEEKNKWGRPRIITEVVLDKLCNAFTAGMNDEEACIFSEISTDVLYKYQRENPEFIKKKEYWKRRVILQARINIYNSVKKWDIQDSKWLLERKARNEFGNRVWLIDDTDIKQNEITPEEEEMHARILKFKSLQK